MPLQANHSFWKNLNIRCIEILRVYNSLKLSTRRTLTLDVLKLAFISPQTGAKRKNLNIRCIEMYTPEETWIENNERRTLTLDVLKLHTFHHLSFLIR